MSIHLPSARLASRGRLLTIAAVPALAVFTLAACGTQAEPTASTSAPTGIECSTAGAASDAIAVTGDAGTEPEVTVATPSDLTATETTTVVAGDGAAVEEGDLVGVQYAVYNGTSGDEISNTGFGDAGQTQYFTLTPGQLITGLLDSVGCANLGDRLAVVIPPAEAWGDSGNTNLGIAGTDSVVFVMDVVSSRPAVAEGEPQDAVEGMPTVELDDTGAPTATIPDADPPTDLEVAVLKQGDGATVEEGSSVTVQYTGVNWTTGEVFDSSWERGTPTTFPLSGVVTGFAQGLEGQQVDSQVLVVIPPDLGYGPNGGSGDGSIGADDTIVFVVDILATTPAAG